MEMTSHLAGSNCKYCAVREILNDNMCDNIGYWDNMFSVAVESKAMVSSSYADLNGNP